MGDYLSKLPYTRSCLIRRRPNKADREVEKKWRQAKKPTLNYFMNYLLYEKTNAFNAGYFTHPCDDRFVEYGKEMDFAVVGCE
jgi:hypothetical protein